MLTLSEEDKRLLEKWKTMHRQSKTATTTKTLIDPNDKFKLPIDTVPVPVVQPVLMQQILVPTQTISLPNQNQTLLNIVQVPAETTVTTEVESAVNYKGTIERKTQIGAEGTVGYSLERREKMCVSKSTTTASEHSKTDEELASTTEGTTCQPPFHRDQYYHKPEMTGALNDVDATVSKEHLRTDTCLDTLTQKMTRSHIDDLTLAQTPKGSGGGYGLGDELANLLEGNLGTEGTIDFEGEDTTDRYINIGT